MLFPPRWHSSSGWRFPPRSRGRPWDIAAARGSPSGAAHRRFSPGRTNPSEAQPSLYLFLPVTRPVPRDQVVSYLDSCPGPAILAPTTTAGIVSLLLLSELQGDRLRWAQDTFARYRAHAHAQGRALDLTPESPIVLEFDEPAAALIKHTNPCGAATGSDAADAYIRARDADPLSAFGAAVALDRPIDAAAAAAIASTRIDAVIAPSIDEDARAGLAKKTAMRVVTADFSSLANGPVREVRSILGALLVQQADRVDEARQAWPTPDLRVATRREPTAEEWRALRFAWRLCAHVKSNTVVFTGADRTLAIGAGQMSRVDAVNVARMKAAAAGGDLLRGSVAASDAFFPFRDGLDAVAAAGATAVVQPGGSVKDAEVIAAADEHGLAMVFTGRRHFRH